MQETEVRFAWRLIATKFVRRWRRLTDIIPRRSNAAEAVRRVVVEEMHGLPVLAKYRRNAVSDDKLAIQWHNLHSAIFIASAKKEVTFTRPLFVAVMFVSGVWLFALYSSQFRSYLHQTLCTGRHRHRPHEQLIEFWKPSASGSGFRTHRRSQDFLWGALFSSKSWRPVF